ncbi:MULTISPECIES: Fur family transcriptional regulator [Anaerococcus]|uniref:Transcriptional repressor n=1 Tax=Anaerococcus nagyae TaxID=1755241 RepID=A0A3E2TIN7_9FIRM|nr:MULTISPECIES: Fur family transcriptional regulator [Anaerococcus]MBP2069734.1 Fur family ferric uptake transcriptional regulator [Anaerococcus nagyae]MDU2565583.1 Fur family transcriptional regulator [Anaerococcus sp.]MDU3211305.1 Fur family transcriptional regulator [Anaerococcus sp.]RGB76556.1 transcriptional repressor [Anaerococcus nagyae]
METNEIRKIFEKNNQKFTKQREIIFNVLKDSSPKHVTPEELFSKVHEDHKQVGIATIYRTLNIFEELGIVNKQEFTDQAYTYELIDPVNDHHDHIICTNCGKIMEDKCLSNNELANSLKKDYGFDLKYYSLRIYGICSDCQDKKE